MTSIQPNNVHQLISDYMLVDGFPLVVDLTGSQGSRIRDSVTGRTYLDCCQYIASNPLGHNHQKMFEAKFEKKLLHAARGKPSNSDFVTVEMAEFVKIFAELAKPAEFKHMFFVEGGALAVENALKVAFDWKVRLNYKKGIQAEKGNKVIHFKEAFHGRSGYTLSLTNTADPKKHKYFPKFDWPRITNPKIQFPLVGQNLDAVIAAEKQALEEISTAFKANPDEVAAIIIEPIQGEGGDNHFRAEFHQALRKVADQNEAMLIYDEVQSGLGLTGKLWAYQHFGIVPDIICFGKKTQVCGIMVGPKVDQAENNVFIEASRLNSTWGGSLTDMVRAGRYLEIIEEEKLVENAKFVGEELISSLENLQNKFPKLFSNARGKGLMCAIDLPTTEQRNAFANEMYDQGVIVLKCGISSLRLRPALTFSKVEVRELIEVFEKVAQKQA